MVELKVPEQRAVDTDVCVVGAGPAGALLSYLLVKQGIQTVLIERHAKLDSEFRGEHLHRDVEQLLRRHELFDKVAARGVLPMKCFEIYHGQKRVFTVYPEMFNLLHLGIHFPQKSLLGVLIEESSHSPRFQLFMKTSVKELLYNSKGAVTGVRADSDGQSMEVNCSAVIAADGRFSTVRKLAGIRTETKRFGYDVLWAKIPAPEDWEPTMRIRYIADTQLSVFAQTGGYVQIGWAIDEGSFAKLRKQSFQPFIDALLTAEPKLKQSIEAHIHSWDDFSCLPVISNKCSTWVQDGLVLMGDAAHTMSPAGGIGVNVALQDAEYLAEVIQQAVTSRDFSSKQFRKFEDIRRPEIEKLQMRQVKQESAQLKLRNSRWRKALFLISMRLIERMPWKQSVFRKLYFLKK